MSKLINNIKLQMNIILIILGVLVGVSSTYVYYNFNCGVSTTSKSINFTITKE